MAKESGKLAAVAIKGLPRGKHADGGGLYLHVLDSGTRAWRMKYRHGGREKLLSFGVFPEVGLAEARQRRAEARALLREGTDPSVHKAGQRDTAKRTADAMFPKVAADWLAEARPSWAPETYRKAAYVVDTYLVPKLRRESFATLSTPVAVRALGSIAEAAPSLASKARQYLGQMVGYAIRHGLRDDGRLLNLRGALPKSDKGHIPAATTPNEAQALVRAIAAYDSPVTRAALQLAMLTAQRPGTIVAAEWAEVDLEAAEWHIPAAKMKQRHAHVVALPSQAVEVLRGMLAYSAGQRYVFPALARQKSPHLHRDSLSKALRDMGLQGQHATHGFRAMFRTVGRERLGIDSDVLEAQLAHAKRGDVQKAYDRTQFLDARREAMQRWADYLDQLREGTAANVVPFKSKAA